MCSPPDDIGSDMPIVYEEAIAGVGVFSKQLRFAAEDSAFPPLV